jgi:hypothetical protein
LYSLRCWWIFVMDLAWLMVSKATWTWRRTVLAECGNSLHNFEVVHNTIIILWVFLKVSKTGLKVTQNSTWKYKFYSMNQKQIFFKDNAWGVQNSFRTKFGDLFIPCLFACISLNEKFTNSCKHKHGNKFWNQLVNLLSPHSIYKCNSLLS